ncbi:MAG: membrane protein insertion efficiency factor YidD [Planctomycetia bacterium]|nr:membrane protein insertion efficiency factor YidD [Planctomycetia bacterium]
MKMSVCRDITRTVVQFPAWVLIGLVRLYQTWISPMLCPHCRYEPTCSEYLIGAVRKYGFLSGLSRGVWRICRCNPWHGGGYDPP